LQNAKEANLAWALVETVRPHLSDQERRHVFVSIGAGDTLVAVSQLLKVISAKEIPLWVDLVWRCTTWLDTYGLHIEAQRLRQPIPLKRVEPARVGRLINHAVAAS
jgi:hypothetical protein